MMRKDINIIIHLFGEINYIYYCIGNNNDTNDRIFMNSRKLVFIDILFSQKDFL